MSLFRKSGIVNVRMVITEEKILSNIDKVQKLINPASKKQIVQLEEDSYFKDLIDSIKTYLIEYPKKKNFPVSVFKACYDLVEFATNQFEENTKEIEELIIAKSNYEKAEIDISVEEGSGGDYFKFKAIIKVFDEEKEYANYDIKFVENLSAVSNISDEENIAPEEKEVKNYRVKEYPENLEGIYELEKQTVTYIMEKIPGKVIVNLKDEEGNIMKVLEGNGYVGEEYEIELPEIEGYFIDGEKILKVAYEDGEVVVDVIYNKVPETGDINVVINLAILILSVAVVTKKLFNFACNIK